MTSPTSMTLLTFLAGAEVRNRWRSLLVLGLLTGLVAGSALGLLAVARRSSTAYDRLRAANAVDDARGMVLGGEEVLEGIRELPEVADAWFAPVAVGQVEGPEIAYFGVAGGFGTDAQAPDLTRLVAVDGRLPAPGATDEVAVAEPLFREFGLRLGQEFTLRWLTPEPSSPSSTPGSASPTVPSRCSASSAAVRLAGSPAAIPSLFTASAVADGDPQRRRPRRLRPPAAPGASLQPTSRSGWRACRLGSRRGRAPRSSCPSRSSTTPTLRARDQRGSGRVLGGGLAVAGRSRAPRGHRRPRAGLGAPQRRQRRRRVDAVTAVGVTPAASGGPSVR